MKMMMSKTYPLEWLDNLILEHLNPNRTAISQLSETDLANISENIVKESARIQIRIKNEIFSLRKKREIRLLIRKYHSSLIFLLDAVVDNRKTAAFETAGLAQAAELIISCLDELLSFLENRFAAYLSLDERVPITYLMVSRNELELKLKKLKQRKCESEGDQIVLGIVIEELSETGLCDTKGRVTFRQLGYERMLLKSVLSLEHSENGSAVFSAFDRLLISLNFNSAQYVNLLKERLVNTLDLAEGVEQKFNTLAYYAKELGQIDSNYTITFNPAVQHLKMVLEQWLQYEMLYMEKKMERSDALASKGAVENKLECDLSADQIGIILRAADEARVVKSRSMSLVFQRIVPHLSTAFKRDLSYQSVRSKSYNAEETDKNTAIMTLEKMIKKIRSY